MIRDTGDDDYHDAFHTLCQLQERQRSLFSISMTKRYSCGNDGRGGYGCAVDGCGQGGDGGSWDRVRHVCYGDNQDMTSVVKWWHRECVVLA